MSSTILVPNPDQMAAVLASPAASSAPAEPTLTAVLKRQAHPLFAQTFSIQQLLPSLPLLFPVDPKLPPSPKNRYRSQYCYLGPQALLKAPIRQNRTDLEIALHLIDLSPLERPLSQMYVPSHKGQVAFHPVSLLVAVCLRLEERKSWRGLAKLLAGEQGAGWRKLCGFAEGNTPSASGLRYFYQTVGPQVFADLCPQFITLLQQHRLCPEHSTYPGDPEGRGISLTQDGQLHPSRSRPSCELATESCYQPRPQLQEPTLPALPQPPALAPESEPPPQEPAAAPTAMSTPVLAPTQPPSPSPTPSRRPCRASERGGEGCACDTPDCQQRCRRASALDPKARFIHYEGHNHKHGPAKDAGRAHQPDAEGNHHQHGPATSGGRADQPHHHRGVNVFGYRSVASRVIDDRFATGWIARSNLFPANTDERTVFKAQLSGVVEEPPYLHVGEVLYDSAAGYEDCLDAIHALGALRMVDIRGDETDQDPGKCLLRGYDGRGYPLCVKGYPLHHNGYDYERRRAKWVCSQRCRKEPLRPGEPVQPVQDCDWFGPAQADGPERVGFVVNVSRTMPDGTTRLAREIAYDSPAWKARYGRRNLSENRNSQLEGMGLKRMRSYGLPRCTKEIQLGDFLIGLRTLGRLVREASGLQTG